MAKVKPTKFQELEQKFRPVYEYEQVLARHIGEDGKVYGDPNQLIPFFLAELKKEGAKDEDLQEVVPELKRRYNEGERELFLQPAQKHQKESVDAYQKYVAGNLEGIINSTDDEILREKVLPVIVGKYKTDNAKYKPLEKLITDVDKMRKSIEDLQDPKKQKKAIKELIDAKKKQYAEKFVQSPYLANIFSSFVSEESVVGMVKKDYLEKVEERDKDLKKDIKPYLKSLGLESKDLAAIYAGIFKDLYETKKE